MLYKNLNKLPLPALLPSTKAVGGLWYTLANEDI